MALRQILQTYEKHSRMRDERISDALVRILTADARRLQRFAVVIIIARHFALQMDAHRHGKRQVVVAGISARDWIRLVDSHNDLRATWHTDLYR